MFQYTLKVVEHLWRNSKFITPIYTMFASNRSNTHLILEKINPAYGKTLISQHVLKRALIPKNRRRKYHNYVSCAEEEPQVFASATQNINVLIQIFSILNTLLDRTQKDTNICVMYCTSHITCHLWPDHHSMQLLFDRFVCWLFAVPPLAQGSCHLSPAASCLKYGE